MTDRSATDPDRLLEREAEVAALARVVGEAAGGGARLVAVEGPAGIGKSRLVAEARRVAREDGLRVLAARGSELEREFPFGVVRQLFEAAAAGPGGERLLQGSAASTVPLFAPPAEGPGLDATFAVLHGLYWLTVNLASDGPLMLAVDDLHWSDRPSLRFLAYLAHRLEGLPLVIVLSLRPNEPGADAALIGEILHDPATAVVRPAPLSAGAAASLIAARLGEEPDEAFTAACVRATGGNPLLLHELVRALADEGVQPREEGIRVVSELGPRAVSRAVLLRLSRLPEAALGAARAVAVLGDGADLAAVAALAGLEEDAAAEGIAALARAEILRPEAPLGFVHPLVHDAVAHDLAPGERERWHSRAAAMLVAHGAPDEQVAAHALSMPRRGEAWLVDALLRAADAARAKGAPESAATYLRRALDEGPAEDRRPGIHLRLGQALALVNGPAALEHLRAAYVGTTGAVERARIAFSLAQALYFTGQMREVVEVVSEASAPLWPDQDDLRLRLEALRLSVAFSAPDLVPLDDAAFAAARGELVSDTTGARMLAALAAYQWAMTGGPAGACAELALRATADGSLQREDGGGVPVVAALIVLAMADREEAVILSGELMAGAHRAGSMFAAAAATCFRGLTLAYRGDLAEAERLLRINVEVHDAWGFVEHRLFWAGFLAQVRLERSDPAGAITALAGAQQPADPPESSNVSWLFAARLRVLLQTGDPGDVVAMARECERRFPGYNPGWVPWRSVGAQALDRLGRTAEAVRWAADEVRAARRWGAPRVLGRALRTHGMLLREEGMVELREAVALLEGSPARLEHAKALAALGTALRLARRPTDARAPLREALEIAGACEATSLVEHVRAELAAAGARPRTESLRGIAALTASERRVVDLAVAGGSNRDIAQALYVTPKTVEVHLSNAYRKLGIRSRRDLPGALAAA